MVLAEKDKEEMDRQLRTALRGYRVEWHTREGAPHNLSDLARVAAGQAKTVILLDPDDAEVSVLSMCLLVDALCSLSFSSQASVGQLLALAAQLPLAASDALQVSFWQEAIGCIGAAR